MSAVRQLSPGIGIEVIENVLGAHGLAADVYAEETVNCFLFKIGHGCFGTGTTISRSKTYWHVSGVSQSPGIVDCVTLKEFFLPARQLEPVNPVSTVNVPRLITGHGGRGIGMAISKPISNSQRSGVVHVAGIIVLSTISSARGDTQES